LIAASRITDVEFTDQRLLFYGAGAAATGIGDLIVTNMQQSGMSHEEAAGRVWFIDSKGLVVSSRDDLAAHKRRYAKEHEPQTDLATIIRQVRPTALIGVSGQPQAFTESVIRTMAELHDRPIIFSLSNPTSKSECTAEQAYGWSDGRAVFASGSPFDPVTINGRELVPGQGNNAYVFPGIGLGIIATQARHVTDAMFSAAAHALADQATDECPDRGCIFPSLAAIREVSARIATAVAEVAYDQGLARRKRPADLGAYIRETMWEPKYE
jgi:malate dehydrogenase (oxaloacetate-decarboxylating)(NADP+)